MPMDIILLLSNPAWQGVAAIATLMTLLIALTQIRKRQ